MSAAPCAERRTGFTLVELLVSMVVLALIALTMAAGLRFVVRATASTDSRREALEELTLGFSVLRGELQRTEPMMHKVGGRDLVLFEGLADRLRFANVEPPYLAGPPYLAYEYAVELDQGVYRINLRRTPIDPDQPDLAVVEAAEPRTVVRVNLPLKFTYWGRLRPRDEPAWHAEWPPGPNLPEAIRLADGEDPGWPELVVPLRINAPWYCGGGAASGGGDAGGGEVGGGGAGGGGEGGGGSPGTAGCPGAKEGGSELLAPGTAAQTPFGAGSDTGGQGGLGSDSSGRSGLGDESSARRGMGTNQ